MQRNVTFEQSEYSDISKDADYFKDFRDKLESMLECAEDFADAPKSAGGAARLVKFKRLYEEAFDLLSADDSPFSHHWMDRLMGSVDYLTGHAGSLELGNGRDVTYTTGRYTEKNIQRLKQRIEELDTICEYAGVSPLDELFG